MIDMNVGMIVHGSDRRERKMMSWTQKRYM